MAQTYDAFLAHDWGEDELGRNNHARVTKVNEALKQAGVVTWFDSDRMRGDINLQMADGLDAAAVVCVFVTQRYMDKVNGRGEAGKDDNCKFEFDYALRRKGVASMLPVVMEPRCKCPSDWTGVVGGKLGGILYVDLSSDDKAAFKAGINHLVREIRFMVTDPAEAARARLPTHPSMDIAILDEGRTPTAPFSLREQLMRWLRSAKRPSTASLEMADLAGAATPPSDKSLLGKPKTRRRRTCVVLVALLVFLGVVIGLTVGVRRTAPSLYESQPPPSTPYESPPSGSPHAVPPAVVPSPVAPPLSPPPPPPAAPVVQEYMYYATFIATGCCHSANSTIWWNGVVLYWESVSTSRATEDMFNYCITNRDGTATEIQRQTCNCTVAPVVCTLQNVLHG